MKVYVCGVKDVGIAFCTANLTDAQLYAAEDARHYYKEFELKGTPDD